VRPQWYGAIGDGATNDATALSACLNSDFPVFLDGLFAITSTITVALSGSKGLGLRGSNRNASQIILNAANIGIDITIATMTAPWSSSSQAATLQNFTIVPKATSTRAALKITGQPTTGSAEKSFYIENVDIVPNNTTNGGAIGFEFFDCRNSNVVGCVIDGVYGAFTGSGIKWWGGTGSAPVGLLVTGCQINWWSKGVELAPNSGGTTTGGNDWQGVTITDCTLLACDYGVYATSVDNFAEWLIVRGCHLNSRTTGVYATDVGLLYVEDNYFLFLGTAPGGTSYSVYTQINNFSGYKAQFGHIIDNSMSFGAAGAAAKVGIFAKTGGTNMWTTIRDNTMISQTLAYDTSPSNFVFPLNLGTSVATTSGTAFDFTIPPGTRRFSLDLSGVSLSGTDSLLVQLGTSGGIVATTYVGVQSYISNGASPIVTAVTAGLGIVLSLASRIVNGVVTFESFPGDVWLMTFNGVETTGSVLLVSSSSKSLGGTLTQIRLTRTGTDTFDAGAANLQF
jgi:hypothetical protein